MNTIPKLDPRARRWGIAAVVVLLLAGFAVAPFIWIALGGLLGLGTAVALIGTLWYFRTWIFDKAANARLKLIKQEARTNPVETLQEDFRRQGVALEVRKDNIEKLRAETLGLGDKLDDFAAKYGKEGRDYAKLLAVKVNLEKVYAHRLMKWKNAYHELERWGDEIERASAIWDAAQAAAAAQEASGLSEDDFFAQIKKETAIDSIQDSYSQALASLDTEMAMSVNPPEVEPPLVSK
jgi:hypothetical protein